MSNLLQKASIITTPTAYDTGKILSVKPVQYYGPELVTNGNFATDSDWVTEGNSTIAVGTYQGKNAANINILNTSTGSRISQAFNYVNGKTYKVSVTVYVESGNFRLDSSDSFVSGDFVSTTTTGSWQTLTTNITAINTGSNYIWLRSILTVSQFYVNSVSVKEVLNADFDFSRNSSATRVGSNGLIQDVASNLPRIDYTGGVGSWKFEPQRTNLLTYSEDFSNGFWSKRGASVVGGQVSPNGGTSAFKLVESSTTDIHKVFENFALGITTGTVVTTSVYAKAGERSILKLQPYIGTKYIYVNFDLSNGTVGLTSGDEISKKIELLSNGYYRCSITFLTDGTSVQTHFVLTDSNIAGVNPSYTGDGTSGLYIWGAQLEEGSYPTSYIITSGQSGGVTRLADVANNAGSSDLINSTQGVLYAEIAAFADDLTSREINISDGSLSNTIAIIYNQPSNNIRFLVRASATTYVDINIVITDITISNKVAFKYKENSFSAFINGFELGSDNSGLVPTGNVLNELSFTRSTARAFYGNTKCVAVFKEALTDLELECLSSWMSFSDLGINFGYTVE